MSDILSTSPGAINHSHLGVAAWAEVDFSPNTITIKVHNTENDMLDIGQAISNLSFTVTQNIPTSLSMVSSNGYERYVATNGTFTDQQPWFTGWSSSFANTLISLTAPNPKDLMVGPPNPGTGLYSSADYTIAGNGPDNPFLGPDASFVLNAPGVTSNTHVRAAQFGLGLGTDAVALQIVEGNPQIPEPASLTLLVGGGALLLRRRRGRAGR